MNHLPRLNFPGFKFRVAQHGEGCRIWDPHRGMWLVLTPEEWVRQHLAMFLTSRCGIPPASLRMECPVSVGGMCQRADLVVYGNDGMPLLVAECKAPDVHIDASVFGQVVRYNAVLGARYIVVTNGLKHFVHKLAPDGSYTVLKEIPEFSF